MALAFPQPPLTVGDTYQDWQWNGVKWVRFFSGGLTNDAPSDTFSYGRVDGNWNRVLPLDGGVVEGTLGVDGDLDLPDPTTISGDPDFSGSPTVGGAAIATEPYVDEAVEAIPLVGNDVALVYTTDELAALSGQTLATEIRRKVENTIYGDGNVAFNLWVIIRPGAATAEPLIIRGLRLRYAMLNVQLDPGVTVSSIDIAGNVLGACRLWVCCNVDGNVNVSYNICHRGDTRIDQNYPGVVVPTYPAVHPLGGTPIPIERSLIRGAVQLRNNTAIGGACGYYLGQWCEVGELDGDDNLIDMLAPAGPGAGTLTSGTIHILYNKSNNYTSVGLYTTYMDDPTIPGAIVRSRIFVQWNQTGQSAYLTSHSGWAPGTEPQMEVAYVQYNTCCSSAFCEIGAGGAPGATSIPGHFTVPCEADPVTTPRSTIVLERDLTPEEEAVVVGMRFSFANIATGSNAGNYTGTLQYINAYNPATRTITISTTQLAFTPVNFTAPRVQAGALGYFYLSAGQTKIGYFNSASIFKTEYLIDRIIAQGADSQAALYEPTGSNPGNAYRIVSVDKTLKNFTIDRGIVSSAGTFTNALVLMGGVGAKSFLGATVAATKIGPATWRSTADQRMYPHFITEMIGCRVDIGGFPGAQRIFRTVVAASWGTTDADSMLLHLTLDADDPHPPHAALNLNLFVRRVPGNGHFGVNYNVCGESARVLMAAWHNGPHGASRHRSMQVSYNHCSDAYAELRDWSGNGVNVDSASRCSYITVTYNVCTAAAYIVARSNNRPNAGNGGIDVINFNHNRSQGDSRIELGTWTSVSRAVNLQYNYCPYRVQLLALVPGGVTLGQANAPLIGSRIYFYRNVGGLLGCNQVRVVMKPQMENGVAPFAGALWFDGNNCRRSYIISAQTWLDISANQADDAACVYVSANLNFDYTFAVPSIYAGPNNYALRVLNAAQVGNILIGARPATGTKIKIEGYTNVHFGPTIATDNMYRLAPTNHSAGRDTNSVWFKDGALLP